MMPNQSAENISSIHTTALTLSLASSFLCPFPISRTLPGRPTEPRRQSAQLGTVSYVGLGCQEEVVSTVNRTTGPTGTSLHSWLSLSQTTYIAKESIA